MIQYEQFLEAGLDFCTMLNHTKKMKNSFDQQWENYLHSKCKNGYDYFEDEGKHQLPHGPNPSAAKRSTNCSHIIISNVIMVIITRSNKQLNEGSLAVIVSVP